jgi:hypothetical protein
VSEADKNINASKILDDDKRNIYLSQIYKNTFAGIRNKLGLQTSKN